MSKVERRAGVCARIFYAESEWLIPLNGEDRGKFEVVVDPATYKPVIWGDLSGNSSTSPKYGLVGGGVKQGEAYAEAMWREWGVELGVLVGNQEAVTVLFSESDFTSQCPALVPGLLVMQARMDEGGWVFRNLFEVWQFLVTLNDEQYAFLTEHAILVPSDRVAPAVMRPYVARLLQVNDSAIFCD